MGHIYFTERIDPRYFNDGNPYPFVLTERIDPKYFNEGNTYPFVSAVIDPLIQKLVAQVLKLSVDESILLRKLKISIATEQTKFSLQLPSKRHFNFKWQFELCNSYSQSYV